MRREINLFVPSNTKRILFFLSFDILLSLMTLYGAYLLRFNFSVPDEFLTPFWRIALLLVLLKTFAIALFKNYKIIWRFYSLTEAKNLLNAHIVAYGTFSIIYIIIPDYFIPFPRSAIIIDLFLSFGMLGILRFAKRLIIESGHSTTGMAPTLIVGISPNTANLIKSSLDGSIPYYPVAIAAIQEKNRNLIGSTIQNLNIIGTEEIEKWVRSRKISAAIIDGSLTDDYLREAYRLLTEAGISEIKRSSLLSDGKETITSLSIEELLARRPKDLDTDTIGAFIRGRTVLITGAGGSIGSEISLQCERFGAKKLILLDNSEYNLYQIGEKLPAAALHLCSVLDRETLDGILDAETVDLLIHAAAYKHVPLCEANPHAAIENNVVGSRNVIDSAIIHNVPKIVIISTDKAVRPTNVMGTTKRIVELYAQNVDPQKSEIVSVRFGNVLGSSGSVIPKFKSQIEEGGPVTITHPEITRYFMLISEACQLVLQAAAIARGGELFILDMGEPVKILDLARTMIRLYATHPIDIVTTGLRPGEKLYEELLIDESEQRTSYESILIARSTPYPIETLQEDMEKLVSSRNVIEQLQKIVPEFKPSGR